MATENQYASQIETELVLVMNMLEKQFDKDYAKKNPDMVRHLMDKIQEQKYIEMQRTAAK